MPIPLPNAVPGHVVTRFPPEPSWHLDIGHCKAALMNQFIADQFQGQWILRFDDTNPKTCSGPCVESYIQDMPLLGLTPDKVSHASDYFQQMNDDVEQLIQSAFLYADDTPVDTMREQRLNKQASAARDRPISASVEAWAAMKAGSTVGQTYCLRFRLQPDSENGALRDPVAYRVTMEPHYKTGTRYKVYPTYDYAAPWLDAAEGVTHALRTLEFRDRDILYNTVQGAVIALHPGWRPSTIWEFPRIHMAWTPQAKVHQRALLSAGLVDGPTDPRLPTLRGLMRGGCHPDALRAFLLEQVTPARKETYHSWDKLWTINRRLLDPSASRHMAVMEHGKTLLHVIGGPDAPEPATVQWKQGHIVKVVRYKDVWIDEDDAKLLTEGDEVTLLAWGTVRITSVDRTAVQEADANRQQQQQQDKPASQLSVGTVAPDAGDTAAAAAVAAGKDSRSSRPAPPQPQTPPLLPPAAAAAATESLGCCNFEKFTDVLTLRDEIMRAKCIKGGRYSFTSSVASTAGSTAVPPSALLDQELELATQMQDCSSTGLIGQSTAAVAVASPVNQRQQQLVPDQSAQTLVSLPGPTAPAATDGCCSSTSNCVTPDLIGRFDPVGDPKRSKLKIHWLPALPNSNSFLLPLKLVYYSHPITVDRVVEEVDVVAQFNHDSRRECLAWGDPSLLQSAQKGAVIQLQRKGLFIVDEVIWPIGQGAPAPAAWNGSAADFKVPTGAEQLARGAAAASAAESPAGDESAAPAATCGDEKGVAGPSILDVEQIVLIAIPDGHTKHELSIKQ